MDQYKSRKGKRTHVSDSERILSRLFNWQWTSVGVYFALFFSMLFSFEKSSSFTERTTFLLASHTKLPQTTSTLSLPLFLLSLSLSLSQKYNRRCQVFSPDYFPVTALHCVPQHLDIYIYIYTCIKSPFVFLAKHETYQNNRKELETESYFSREKSDNNTHAQLLIFRLLGSYQTRLKAVNSRKQ